MPLGSLENVGRCDRVPSYALRAGEHIEVGFRVMTVAEVIEFEGGVLVLTTDGHYFKRRPSERMRLSPNPPSGTRPRCSGL